MGKTVKKTAATTKAPTTPAPKAKGKSQASQRAAAVETQTQAQNLSAWEQAKQSSTKGRGGTTVPAGKYKGTLTAARLATINGDDGEVNKPIFTFTVFDHPEHDGGTIERWGTALETEDPQQLDFLARDLRNLGVDVDSMTDPKTDITQDLLDELVTAAPACNLAVQESKKDSAYLNVYINSPILGEGDAGTTDATDTADEVVEEDVIDEEEEVVDEEATMDVDSNVSWESGGQTAMGVIVKFEEEGAKALVRRDDNRKIVRVATSKLSLVDPG